MTEPLDCWILPHERAGGPENMAKDEALLDFAASHPGWSVFRTYEWSEPTLSLGYFQSYESVENDERWNGAAVVRRITGGGALWHDKEITYALVLSRDHPMSSRTVALYEWVHEAIVNILSSQGFLASRRGTSPTRLDLPAKPFLCFRDSDANDILFQGHKIVGSAQRRRSGAVLQHGSILLRSSPRTPELPGIMNLTDQSPALGEVARSLLIELPKALEFRERVEDWPAGIIEQSRSLLESRYLSEGWNHRR